MSRRLRWIEPHSLTEITDRCFQGRFLLRPSPQLNRLIIGIFARARELYPIKLHSLSVMSNHWHAQISADNAQQLADFMEFRLGSGPRKIRGTLYIYTTAGLL